MNKKTKNANSKQLTNIQFGTPLEMKIEDALFVKIRKNMFLIKDLNNPNIHYSFFWIGSIFDMHITSEDESDPKKRHIPLVKLKRWENKILFSYLLQRKEMLRLFTTILYRQIFKNFLEMSRSLVPRIDKTMEKIDQILHLT